MKPTFPILALAAVFALSACDRPAVVVAPTVPVAVPGPAGPSGATGATGSMGAPGKPGEGTTVIVTPAAPASAPTN